MTVAVAWKRMDVLRKTRVVFAKITYTTADTSLVLNTGLKKIYSYDTSPTSLSGKYITNAAVSGGTITLTATNPAAPCYVFVTAFGI